MISPVFPNEQLPKQGNTLRIRFGFALSMSSTQDYLKKYMSKPASLEEHKKRKLKKKKSTKTSAPVKKGNFAIHDDDEDSWKNPGSESDEDDDCKLRWRSRCSQRFCQAYGKLNSNSNTFLSNSTRARAAKGTSIQIQLEQLAHCP